MQQELTVSAARGKQCVDITITDDDVPEEKEIFQIKMLNIQRVEANDPGIVLHTTSALVTIVDDDCKITAAHVNV